MSDLNTPVVSSMGRVCQSSLPPTLQYEFLHCTAMSTTNLALVYKAIPEGAPVDGVHLVVESRELDGAARPPSHGWIARLLHAGFDPYLRNLMKTPDESQGFPALELGSVINNAIIVEVLQSNREGIEPGHILRGFGPIQEHIVADADTASAYERLPNDGNMLLPLFLGCLGVSGLAGYSSFFEIGQPVSGETILITAAAGAIGQVVGQAARHVGLKVLGAVGSDEKLRLLTGRLGFHGGLNHRNGNLESRIHQLAPQGIDSELKSAEYNSGRFAKTLNSHLRQCRRAYSGGCDWVH